MNSQTHALLTGVNAGIIKIRGAHTPRGAAKMA